MKIIAHRGNLTGPNPSIENTVTAIEQCIKQGFDIEIDVWAIDGKLWLGHDNTRNPIPLKYLILKQNNLWIHAKNIAAAEFLAATDLHWFWHEQDTLTLTSKKIIWCHHAFIKNGITMLHHENELNHLKPGIGGICTDYAVSASRILGEDNG